MERADLNILLKHVAEALKMDEKDSIQEAYGKYIQCMISLINSLWVNYSASGSHINDPKKVYPFVKLGQQCMDRVATIVEKLYGDPSEKPYDKPDPQTLAFLKEENLAPMSSYLEMTTSNAFIKPKDSTPLEVAHRQNQQLMFAYKARLSQTNSCKRQQDLSLTLQRKMAENIAIAKAREEALAKKMKERQQLLEQQAARRFSLSMDLSKEDQQQRLIYKKILEYELDVKWLQESRQKLSADPKNPAVMKEVIQNTFRCVDHPLSIMVQKYQHKLCRNLLKLTQNRLHELNDVTVPLETSLTTYRTDQHKASCHSTPKQDPNFSFEKAEKKSNTNIPEEKDKPVDKFTDNEKEILSSPEDSLADAVVSTKAQLRIAYDVGKETESTLCQDINNTLKATESSKIDTDLISDSEPSEEGLDISEMSVLISEEDKETQVELLTNEAYKRHLQNFTKDILLYMEQLVKTFTTAYEELGSAEGRDQCYAYIEDKFFRPVWPHLILLYRIVNHEEELKAAKMMTQHLKATPRDLGISPELCLEESSTADNYPYKAAVLELCSVKNYTAPLLKMECLVRAIRQICQCISEHQQTKQTTVLFASGEVSLPNIGADDLLPILHYVLIRTESPQLVSECVAIEELVHEGYLLGEGGYCLTSIRTALGYLTSLADQPAN